VIPAVPYLQAIGLGEKKELIQALGLFLHRLHRWRWPWACCASMPGNADAAWMSLLMLVSRADRKCKPGRCCAGASPLRHFRKGVSL